MPRYSAGQQFWGCTLIRPNRPKWVVLCRCGVKFECAIDKLVSGHTRSCGCLRTAALVSRSTVHGQARRSGKSKAYSAWRNMKTRCENPNFRQFHRYGGRGISVAPEWATFDAFYTDMGDPPIGYSLERMDNDAGYSKSNCVWAPRSAQMRNTRRTRSLTHAGETKCLADWAALLGVSHATLFWYLGRYGDAEGLAQAVSKHVDPDV